MHKSIVHFEIYGDNPPKLASFYEQLFGWKFENVPMGPGNDYWLIKTVPTDKEGRPTAPGVNGGMMKRPMPDARAWVDYVGVDSIEESLRELQKLGGTVIRPKSPVPKMGWFAIVTDPEKNVFALWENDAKAS